MKSADIPGPTLTAQLCIKPSISAVVFSLFFTMPAEQLRSEHTCPVSLKGGWYMLCLGPWLGLLHNTLKIQNIPFHFTFSGIILEKEIIVFIVCHFHVPCFMFILFKLC